MFIVNTLDFYMAKFSSIKRLIDSGSQEAGLVQNKDVYL